MTPSGHSGSFGGKIKHWLQEEHHTCDGAYLVDLLQPPLRVHGHVPSFDTARVQIPSPERKSPEHAIGRAVCCCFTRVGARAVNTSRLFFCAEAQILVRFLDGARALPQTASGRLGKLRPAFLLSRLSSLLWLPIGCLGQIGFYAAASTNMHVRMCRA